MNMARKAVLVLLLSLLVTSAQCKIFNNCELARELKNRFGIQTGNNELANYVCIAVKESSLNTAAINKVNSDQSWDHGLFQINDQYWCGRFSTGKGCNVNCAQLRTDDITAAVRCAKTIRNQQGWWAWVAFRDCANGQSAKYIQGCGV